MTISTFGVALSIDKLMIVRAGAGLINQDKLLSNITKQALSIGSIRDTSKN